MPVFSNHHIAIATTADIPTLTLLMNSAYRGEESKKGWTTEEHLIAGDTRTNEANLQEIMRLQNSIVLKYTDEQGQLIGCVNLQLQYNKVYLGMLSVAPQLQGGGIGKFLLNAAEEYAKQTNSDGIYMTVISARTELIDWYKRHGYKDTGERKAFVEDDVTGKHLQPLEFMKLEKNL